jgi:anti-sigma regulatory factor (Ser/Thr protein kinase)
MNDVSPAQRLAIGPADVAHSAIMRTELPADLASARQARSAVRQALAVWGMDDLSGDAELLASELVANAVEHGDGQPVSLALRRYADPDGRPAITCEITGAAPRFAPRLVPGPDAERGRGLAIVEALARSSGVRPSQACRTSWFTLASTDPDVWGAQVNRASPRPETLTGCSSA